VLARWVVSSLTLVIALSMTARAQNCGSRERAAMELTSAAREEFRAAQHARAIELLEQAYSLCPQPIILFNLGRVHHENGDLHAARDDFHRYLEAQPNTRDRPEVERRLETIERAIAEEEALAQEARESREHAERAREEAEAARRAAAQAAHREQPGPWILGASGIVVLGVATGLAIAAMVESNVAPDIDHLRASQAEQRAQALAIAANVGFGVGGAVLLAGVIWEIAVLAIAPDLEVHAGLNGVSMSGRY
jgi:tetratricopeptide (TPR) repeat protein